MYIHTYIYIYIYVDLKTTFHTIKSHSKITKRFSVSHLTPVIYFVTLSTLNVLPCNNAQFLNGSKHNPDYVQQDDLVT